MRGNDPGKDFDDQHDSSSRRARARKARGEGAWYYDKKLEQPEREPVVRRRKHAAPIPSSDNCVVVAASLGGLAWAAAEIVKRVMP